jgi:hypothetical protein
MKDRVPGLSADKMVEVPGFDPVQLFQTPSLDMGMMTVKLVCHEGDRA